MCVLGLQQLTRWCVSPMASSWTDSSRQGDAPVAHAPEALAGLNPHLGGGSYCKRPLPGCFRAL